MVCHASRRRRRDRDHQGGRRVHAALFDVEQTVTRRRWRSSRARSEKCHTRASHRRRTVVKCLFCRRVY